MHTYRPGNLRDEIPKEGGFGPPRAVTPWKKKNIFVYDNCCFNCSNEILKYLTEIEAEMRSLEETAKCDLRLGLSYE
jgi:hypothetical protein